MKEPIVWGERPSDSELSRAERLVCSGHPVGALVRGALSSPWQQEVIGKLSEAAERGTIVALCVEDPIDAAAFPMADVVIAAYGTGPLGLHVAARALAGRIRWNGRLPIDMGKCLRTRIQTGPAVQDLTWYTTEDPLPGARHLERMSTGSLVAHMTRLDAEVNPTSALGHGFLSDSREGAN